MAEDLTLRAIIKAVFTGKGLKESKDALGGVEKGAKKAGKETKKAGLEVDQLGRKLKTLVGGAVLIAFVKGAVFEFAKFERALKATEIELDRLGLGAEKQLPRIKAFLNELERGPGILRQDALPQFNKFLGILQDTDAAMLAVQVASGAAQGGYKDFGTAAALFGSLLQGEVIEPAKSLGIAVFDSAGEVRNLGDVLDETISKFTELNKEQSDTQSALDQGAAAWNELKMAVGEGLKVLVGVGGALRFVIKTLKSIGPVALAASSTLIGVWRGVAKFFQEFSLKKLLLGDLGDLRDAFAAALKEGVDVAISTAEGARDELAAIWAETGEESGLAEEDARTKIKEVAQRARLKKEEAAANVARKAAEARAKQIAAIELKADLDLLRARLAAARGNSEERLKIELEILERQRKAAIKAAMAIGASTAAINAAFDLAAKVLKEDKEITEREAELALHGEFLDAKLELEQAYLDDLGDVRIGDLDRIHEAELERFDAQAAAAIERADRAGKGVAAVEAKWAKKRQALEIRQAKALRVLDEQVKQVKIESQLAIANASIALGRAVFGDIKAFAVADVVIKTIQGVQSALALFPPNPILAGLIAALGAANVVKIISTEPGSSGGLGAPSLGGASAAIGQGASQAVGAIPVGSIVQPPPPGQVPPTNIDNSITVNGNIFGGKPGMRQLRRNLDAARRTDRRVIQ